MSTLRTTTLQHGSSAIQNLVLDNQGRAIFGPDGPQGRAALCVNAQLNRVGVNTETPSVALDVDGAINATGNTTLGGSLTVTGNLSFSGDIDADGEFLTIGGIQVTSNLTPTTGAGWEIFRSSGGFAQMRAYDRSGGALLGGRINTANWRLGEDGESYFLGNFGIGTSSPNTNLVVKGASNSLTNSVGNINVISTDSAAINAGGSIGLGGFYNGTSNSIPFANLHGKKENGTGNNAAGYFAISTRNASSGTAERMRIDSSGNVGIGISSPQTKFHSSGTTNGAQATFCLLYTSPSPRDRQKSRMPSSA